MDDRLVFSIRRIAQHFLSHSPISPAEATAALDLLIAQLAELRLEGRSNELPASLLWGEVGTVLQSGWLQLRAREKPRGYAGDYEMLAAIFEERLCDHPVGRWFDQFFQNQAAPRAVRNRMRLVSAWLARLSAGKFVSVGCGSALEVAAGLKARERLGNFDRLAVSLLDLDPAAVAQAEMRVSPLVDASTSLFQVCNLARLPARSAWHGWLAEAQLLVCTGLFDYLDDAAAVQMLSLFWKSLAPGGSLRVFNFAPWNPTRHYMEWIGAWYLTYRDRSQMLALAQNAGIPAECVSLAAEPGGIDLFLTASRPS